MSLLVTPSPTHLQRAIHSLGAVAYGDSAIYTEEPELHGPQTGRSTITY